MTKICGFTCEHNKSGICQKTMCVKHTYVTFVTRQAGKTLYNNVLEKNKELQDRIDKAIKYLKLFDENSTLIDHSVIKRCINYSKRKWKRVIRFNIDELLTLYVLVKQEFDKVTVINSSYADMLYKLLKKLKDVIENHGIFELKDEEDIEGDKEWS